MHPNPGARLSTNLSGPDEIPYFLWDEPMTVRQFRLRLDTASMPEQNRLLAKLLREARDTDVWLFISPRRSIAPLAGSGTTTWAAARLLGVLIWSLAEGRVAC